MRLCGQSRGKIDEKLENSINEQRDTSSLPFFAMEFQQDFSNRLDFAFRRIEFVGIVLLCKNQHYWWFDTISVNISFLLCSNDDKGDQVLSDCVFVLVLKRLHRSKSLNRILLPFVERIFFVANFGLFSFQLFSHDSNVFIYFQTKCDKMEKCDNLHLFVSIRICCSLFALRPFHRSERTHTSIVVFHSK